MNIQFEEKMNITPKNWQKIRTKKLKEIIGMALNKQGTLMVTCSYEQIQIWYFNKGKMLQKLGLDNLQCFVFSKIHSWFISGSDSHLISFKQEGTVWVQAKTEKYDIGWTELIILNRNEDQLMVCENAAISVWKLDCQKNIIIFDYTLKRDREKVRGLSLNESESFLVSFGWQTLYLWMKINDKWEYVTHVKVGSGNLISFVNDYELLVQPLYRSEFYMFQIKNKRLILKHHLKINVENSSIYFESEFPTIYNEKKKIIMARYKDEIYIIQGDIDKQFSVVLKPIKCSKNNENTGYFAEDGQRLVVWDNGTGQLGIYLISY